AYDANRRATGSTLAARGQLYAGAYQQAQNVIGRRQLQSEDALQKSLIAFLASNTQAGQRARTSYETGAARAEAGPVAPAQQGPPGRTARTPPRRRRRRRPPPRGAGAQRGVKRPLPPFLTGR